MAQKFSYWIRQKKKWWQFWIKESGFRPATEEEIKLIESQYEGEGK